MSGPGGCRPEDIADLVRRSPARLGATRLVAVDGPAGSGKTTLADRLAAALGDAPVVHLDDMYDGWTGLAPGLWHRLREQVLEPVAAGRPARYQRYDWAAGAFDGWVEVPPTEVLVVEGVGAGARPVTPWLSLLVWVEAPSRLRLARGVARDGEALRTEWERWRAREDAHFRADRTRSRADVVIDRS